MGLRTNQIRIHGAFTFGIIATPAIHERPERAPLHPLAFVISGTLHPLAPAGTRAHGLAPLAPVRMLWHPLASGTLWRGLWHPCGTLWPVLTRCTLWHALHPLAPAGLWHALAWPLAMLWHALHPLAPAGLWRGLWHALAWPLARSAPVRHRWHPLASGTLWRGLWHRWHPP